MIKLDKRWVGTAAAVAVLLMAALAWALKPEAHMVTVTGLESSPVTFKTTAQELGEALKAQGIALGDKDQVSPALDTSLKGMKQVAVQVRKALNVTLTADGKSAEIATAALTVGDLLKEQAITLGEKDAVSVPQETALTAGMQIKVTRRTEQVVVEQVEIPFETIREDDRSMLVGESKEVQAGVPGITEVRKLVYLEDGQEVKSEVLEESVVSEPVNRIVAFGTAGIVSRGGENIRYTRQMTLSATGYTAGKESNPDGNGYTYTGMRAVRGVVAVDPNVIPLYTRLYVDGYGYAIAADIGGAIKGNKIDLCFDTVSEALEWGRRPVTVYILSD